MRHSILGTLALIATCLGGSLLGQAAQSDHPPRDPAANAPYPDQVSLMQNRAGQWTYLEAKEQHPLYVSDQDPRDKSTCYDLCDTKWIPLDARPDAKPLGEWTLITRKGGERQWAYRHRAVYMLVHDLSDTPLGDGKDGRHLLPIFK
jgi:predicted lipoprotein with Yx(FWY)xxD motif